MVAVLKRHFLGALIAATLSAQSPIPGPVIVANTAAAGGALHLREVTANGQHVTGFKAPASLAADVVYEMPASDGNAGDSLQTDGAGVLSWGAGGGGYWSRSGTKLTTTTAGDDVELDNHLLFSAASVSDIGAMANYGQSIYMENADFAPTGLVGNWTQVRKLEVVDAGGGDTFWDIQSTANGTINTVLYFRDNAGEQIMRLVRRESSLDTRQAQFTLSLVPGNNSTTADNTYDVGTSDRSWKDGWFDGTLTVNNLTVTGTCTGCGSSSLPVVDTTSIVEGSVDNTKEVRIEADGITTATVRVWTAPDANITVAGIDLAQTWTATQTFQHIQFPAASTYDIGTSANYGQTIYVENVDAAPSGVTSNYLKGRKLEVADDAGGTSFWDFQSKANATNSTLYLRDASGGMVVDFHRIDSTASVDYANFYVDLYPDSGGSQKLGKSGQQWGQVWATDTYTNYIHQISGSYIYSYAHLAPIANATYDLGENSTPFRWRHFYFTGSLVQGGTTRLDGSGNATVVDLTVTGTCTGCGSGTNYWTRSGTDVRPVTDGDDVTVRTSGGTQTHRLRASDGAHLAGAIYTGASPTWTQRIDSSGNVTALSLTVNSTYFINSSGAAFLGTVTLGDIYQAGPTSRLSSGGVFNGASFNVAGTEVISSGRVFKPVSLDVNGTANVIDSSRNATFTGLTFGASSALVQGSTTRISTGGKGTFVGVEIGSGQSLDQGGTARVDASGNGRFASLYIGSTQRIDSSGNMNTPSITIATSYSIGSGGTAILGSVFATDYWQGATSRISSSGVFNAASYQVSATSVIDSSRNTNFVNLKATGQLWFPYTDDNSWAIGDGGTTTTAKLAIYDTNGSFIGWVPVFP